MLHHYSEVKQNQIRPGQPDLRTVKHIRSMTGIDPCLDSTGIWWGEIEGTPIVIDCSFYIRVLENNGIDPKGIQMTHARNSAVIDRDGYFEVSEDYAILAFQFKPGSCVAYQVSFDDNGNLLILHATGDQPDLNTALKSLGSLTEDLQDRPWFSPDEFKEPKDFQIHSTLRSIVDKRALYAFSDIS